MSAPRLQALCQILCPPQAVLGHKWWHSPSGQCRSRLPKTIVDGWLSRLRSMAIPRGRKCNTPEEVPYAPSQVVGEAASATANETYD